MAGQLGNESATVLNQRVVRIDQEKSLLYLLGNVPGSIGTLVKVRDAVKKMDKQMWDLQYPTYVPKAGSTDPNVLTWDGGDLDPFENFFHDNDVVSGPVGNED